METDFKQEQQRLTQQNSEAIRKESDLRQSLKAREDELVKTKATLNSMEKKFIAQDEQIRRLHAQAKI